MKIHYLASFVFVGAVLFLGAAKLQTREIQYLHLIEHAATDTVTDTGVPGDSVGDILTFANPVYNDTNTQQVGTDNGYCVRTIVGSAWECFWTLTLSDGQITVEGPFFDTADSWLAITGGTRNYGYARGQMQLHARDAKGSEYDFKYSISDWSA